MIRRGLVLAAAWFLGFPPLTAHAAVIDAYAWPTSVQPGDTVSICISSSQPAVDVQILRYGASTVPYAFYAGVASGLQAVPDSAYLKGCGWTPTLRIPIPDSWPSGVYAASVSASASTANAPFVVKAQYPGTTSRMLFSLSLATMQAYNEFGGKSLYPFNSTDSVPSYAVSMRRPFTTGAGLSNFPTWAMKFIQFVESHGYAMEYCNSADLDRTPGLPMNYGVVVSAGHDEYWSRPMRSGVAAHVARGGSALFFGGNTCWWQIRFEGDDRIVCHKGFSPDPLRGISDSLVTVRWFDIPVVQPENSLTGVSFRNGGYANFSGYYLAAEGYGGYVAYHTNHWAFAGTHLGDGDTLGRSGPIVGYETDGALYHFADGKPVVSGGDGTPSNYVILGIAPASKGAATMGLYESPGLVFNACATDWSKGLAADSIVQRITLNIVNQALASTASLAPPLVGACCYPDEPCAVATRADCELSGGYYRGDGTHCTPTLCLTAVENQEGASGSQSVVTVPNPSHGDVVIRYRLVKFSAVTIDVLDASGRRVRQMRREPSPVGEHSLTWDGRDSAGNALPAGVYFALTRTLAGVTMRKITLAR